MKTWKYLMPDGSVADVQGRIAAPGEGIELGGSWYVRTSETIAREESADGQTIEAAYFLLRPATAEELERITSRRKADDTLVELARAAQAKREAEARATAEAEEQRRKAGAEESAKILQRVARGGHICIRRLADLGQFMARGCYCGGSLNGKFVVVHDHDRALCPKCAEQRAPDLAELIGVGVAA